METDSIDLISSLPDALLCHILSFVSTKDAAVTSVLSKRWRFLLTSVPNLDFDSSIYDHRIVDRIERLHFSQRFNLFVHRVMFLQGNAPLNKFSLRCEIGSNQSRRVDGWIDKALKRNVAELYLYITSKSRYMLPPKVLMSENLIKLKLVRTEKITIDVREVFLPKLKTLHINNVAFNNDETATAFVQLISSCQALEELIMINDMVFWIPFSVSNPNLKRLTFFCKETDEKTNSISFDTPNLRYLDYTNNVAAEYPKVNFDSLIEASLCLLTTRDELESGDDYSPDFFMGMRNVRILYLSSNTFEVLSLCTIPVFNNVLHLTIETSQEVDWKAMSNLLENCPNLETLVFDGFHYFDTIQCSKMGYRFTDRNECYAKDGDKCVCKPWYGTPIWLTSSPVKTLKIFKFGEINENIDDSDKQLELIKCFVETLPNLEQVVLYYDTPCDEDLRRLTTEFRKLEKVASSECKIQVIYNGISFSATVYSSSSASGLIFL